MHMRENIRYSAREQRSHASDAIQDNLDLRDEPYDDEELFLDRSDWIVNSLCSVTREPGDLFAEMDLTRYCTVISNNVLTTVTIDRDGATIECPGDRDKNLAWTLVAGSWPPKLSCCTS